MVAQKSKKRVAKKRTRTAKPGVNPKSPLNPSLSYTSEQLCETLGIERTTLWRWKKLGLQGKHIGNRDYYRGSDVQRFMFG